MHLLFEPILQEFKYLSLTFDKFSHSRIQIRAYVVRTHLKFSEV